MGYLMEYVDKKIKEIENELEKIYEFQKQEMDGTLKCIKRNGKIYYYQQTKDKNGKMHVEYLSRKKLASAKQLAQKAYYKKARVVMEQNLKTLQHFQSKYKPDKEGEIFDSLPEEYKALVKPFYATPKEMLKRWNDEEYETFQEYPESLRYETEKGELVRSKSEVIIANLLYKYDDVISYKYERPLELVHRGKRHTIHPDFTVFNKLTGKITYWEHAGLMDEPQYEAGFVWKNNLYYENNIIPGKDVLFSFESETHPLDISVVNLMVEQLLKG